MMALSIYYKRYQGSIGLFQELAGVLERERPFIDGPNSMDEKAKQAVWTGMDKFAVRLGDEWKQAVMEAAQNPKVPDFMNINTDSEGLSR